MNQILNFDDEEQLKQMNTIHDYNHQIELFQKVIEDIMTHLKDVKVPSKMMYGEQDDEAYALSAQFIYDHLGTSNKELNSFAMWSSHDTW